MALSLRIPIQNVTTSLTQVQDRTSLDIPARLPILLHHRRPNRSPTSPKIKIHARHRRHLSRAIPHRQPSPKENKTAPLLHGVQPGPHDKHADNNDNEFLGHVVYLGWGGAQFLFLLFWEEVLSLIFVLKFGIVYGH